MIKLPNVAGTFYPARKEEILAMMDQFFANVDKEIIPNHLQSSEKNRQQSSVLKAIVAPHAGYTYSGQVAAYSYSMLKGHLSLLVTRNSSLPTFVVLAPSHYEYFEGVSVGLFDTFKTPLGDIDTDMKLGKKLINEYSDYFSFIPATYDQEHAVEVQLPFLQYIASDGELKIKNGKLKILPLIFGNVNPIEIGKILFELSKKEEMFFIVSSDLSHFMEYDNAIKVDKETLQNFLDKDIEIIVHGAEACGIHPWLALTQIAIQSKWTPELLEYKNSGDTAGDKSRVVGYGSVIYH